MHAFFKASHAYKLFAFSKTNAHVLQEGRVPDEGAVAVALYVGCPFELGGIRMAGPDVTTLERFELLLRAKFVGLVGDWSAWALPWEKLPGSSSDHYASITENLRRRAEHEKMYSREVRICLRGQSEPDSCGLPRVSIHVTNLGKKTSQSSYEVILEFKKYNVTKQSKGNVKADKR